MLCDSIYTRYLEQAILTDRKQERVCLGLGTDWGWQPMGTAFFLGEEHILEVTVVMAARIKNHGILPFE